MKKLKEVWYTQIVILNEKEEVKREDNIFSSQTEVLRYFNTYKVRGNNKIISFGASMEMGLDI